jgi:hypothetical protein
MCATENDMENAKGFDYCYGRIGDPLGGAVMIGVVPLNWVAGNSDAENSFNRLFQALNTAGVPMTICHGLKPNKKRTLRLHFDCSHKATAACLQRAGYKTPGEIKAEREPFAIERRR